MGEGVGLTVVEGAMKVEKERMRWPVYSATMIVPVGVVAMP